MYKYHCLNPIADIGLNNFTEDYTKIDTAEGADALLVRSAVMHDMEFDKNLKAIGRAGAGVNNIPLDTCAGNRCIQHTGSKCKWCKRACDRRYASCVS